MRIIRVLVLALGFGLVAAPAALADTPGQMFYFPLKKLVGGPFVHGTNFTAFLSSKLSWVGSDCQGAVAMGKPVPKYAGRIYGRKKILTSGCINVNGVWLDSKQYDALPLPKGAIRRTYGRLRRRALRGACHRAHRTVRRGQPYGKHAVVPCSRLRSGRLYPSNPAKHKLPKAVLHYRCQAGHPHRARKIVLDVRKVYGRLAILKFYRRNCNAHSKETQTVNGIWSRKRPRPDPMPARHH